MQKTYDKDGKPMAGGKYDSYGFPLAANRAAAQLDANARAKKLEGKRKVPVNVSSMPKNKKKKSGLGMKSESEKMLSAYESAPKKKKKNYGKDMGGEFARGLASILGK